MGRQRDHRAPAHGRSPRHGQDGGIACIMLFLFDAKRYEQRTEAGRHGLDTQKPDGVWMAKEELLEFDGTVAEVLPDGHFRVKLDNDHIVLAYAAGKMKKNRIRTIAGDRVVVEMSPYDLDRGRINFRQKTAAVGAPAGGNRRPPPRRR
jgi:translation initiation factor IF-1